MTNPYTEAYCKAYDIRKESGTSAMMDFLHKQKEAGILNASEVLMIADDIASVFHKPFCLVRDWFYDVDSEEFDTEADAIEAGLEWLTECMEEQKAEWKPLPDAKQIEAWNKMIDMHCCYIAKWSDETGEYEDSYYAMQISDDKLSAIGWRKI